MESGKKMAIDAQISNTKDLVINDDGTVPTVDDLDELAQSCSIRLGIWLGHWVINPEAGLDADSIFTRRLDKKLTTQLIRECLQQDPRITDLVSADYSISGRTLNVKLVIEANNQFFEVIKDVNA